MSNKFQQLSAKDLKFLRKAGISIDVPASSISSVSSHQTSTPSQVDESAAPHNQRTSNDIIDKGGTVEVGNTSGFHGDSGYAGDFIDDSAPLREDGLSKLDFDSPAQLMVFYDPVFRQETDPVMLHLWQLEVNEELAHAKATDMQPHKFCLCACNGSGKDAFVIAPFAIWFILTKIKSRVIITSASGVQLTGQTENYIRSWAQKINEFHAEEVFKIRQRYIKCRLTGSEIRMFATDEEGKAEGYHPLEPKAEMAIIVNEAKSVVEPIFGALRRCTGYNYWINVSTPGAPNGSFYQSWRNWPNKRKVTTFDCPHLSPQEREYDKLELGEHSALYRSKHLAEFTSLDTNAIITKEQVDRVYEMRRRITWVKKEAPTRIGIDLAAGGAENSITATVGNKITYRRDFIEKDTVATAAILDHILKEDLGLKKDHEYIFADDGGVGHSIIDMLTNMGWKINRVRNQSTSTNKTLYRNKGAENWNRIKRFFEECCIILPDSDNPTDDKLMNQLYNRYFKQDGTSGRIALEPKKDAIAHGRPSPDRADSLVLAFSGTTVEDFVDAIVVEENQSGSINRPVLLHNQEDIDNWMQEKAYSEYDNSMKVMSSGRKPHNSINSLIARQWKS